MTQSLGRWYPNAEVSGIGRDSNFIQFAKQQGFHENVNIKFMEGDATALPFEEDSFDVVISNTVQEHIEPSKFFGEQYRVLKKGGVCPVLSARRGIHIAADCISAKSSLEETVWKRVENFYQKINQKYNVGQYSMNERELPSAMEQYGFGQISTDYLTINLTPDNPENARELAHSMINAHRQENLDAVNSLAHIAPDGVSEEEILEMQRCINERYDQRINLYDAGKKQWDTSLSLIMVLRGVK